VNRFASARDLEGALALSLSWDTASTREGARGQAMLPRLQEIVLLKIFILGPRCRLAQIQDVLTQEIGESAGWGSVHNTVQRLIDQGRVDWQFEDQNPSGHRRAKLYSLTAAGQRALMDSVRTTRTVYGPILSASNGWDALFAPQPQGQSAANV
jgi:hypothetical protein